MKKTVLLTAPILFIVFFIYSHNVTAQIPTNVPLPSDFVIPETVEYTEEDVQDLIIVDPEAIEDQLDLFRAPQMYLERNMNIQFFPKVTRPFTDVIVDLEAFGLAPRTANIRWEVDGELFREGIGLQRINVPVGALGTSQKVDVFLTEQSTGRVYEKSVTLTPQDVDLLWEGNVHTPPFYKGRALFTRGTELRILAIPDVYRDNGTKIDPEELIYQWEVNDDYYQTQSGYGRQMYEFTTNLNAREMHVELEVLDESGALLVQEDLYLTPETPSVNFYNLTDNGQTYKNAVPDNATFNGSSLTLVAEPMFADNPVSSFSYQWQLNGRSLSGSDTRAYTFVRADDGAGRSRIDIAMRGENSGFQRAEYGLMVNYE